MLSSLPPPTKPQKWTIPKEMALSKGCHAPLRFPESNGSHPLVAKFFSRHEDWSSQDSECTQLIAPVAMCALSDSRPLLLKCLILGCVKSSGAARSGMRSNRSQAIVILKQLHSDQDMVTWMASPVRKGKLPSFRDHAIHFHGM